MTLSVSHESQRGIYLSLAVALLVTGAAWYLKTWHTHTPEEEDHERVEREDNVAEAEAEPAEPDGEEEEAAPGQAWAHLLLEDDNPDDAHIPDEFRDPISFSVSARMRMYACAPCAHPPGGSTPAWRHAE